MRKLSSKISIAMLILTCIMLLCTGMAVMDTSETGSQLFASAASSDSIFSFTPISDTECNVRLSDKTVETAIVPASVMIEGKDYTVTTIASNGFASAANLKKVRLPRTVTTIGTTAFANCKLLESITIPAVESIGNNAFNLCSKLEYLIIPKTVKTVGSTILRSTSVKVYVRVTQAETESLGWNSNWNGNNTNTEVEYNSDFTPEIEYRAVTSVDISPLRASDATPVGYYVEEAQPFSEERDDEIHVYIPATYEGLPVVGIAESAFSYNEIKSITIDYADQPIYIGSYAFNGLMCDKVIINRDVVFEDSMGLMSEDVFTDSEVKTIILPETITEIAPKMFLDCINLQDIHFISPSFRDDARDIDFPSTQSVVLPNNVTTIGEEAFAGVTHILQLYISSNVKNVGPRILRDWSTSNGQSVLIDYNQEADLPEGWDSFWKSGCQTDVIQFQGKFTITYVLNGGSHSGNPTEYTSSDTFVLNDAFLFGYTFDGWYDNEHFEGNPIKTINKGTSGDLILYAKFSANQYEIVYNANKPENASSFVNGSTNTSTHAYNEAKQLNSNGYSLIGWGFIGWNTKADGSGEWYGDGENVLNLSVISGDQIVLYAQWQPSSYTVVYHENKPIAASGAISGSMQNSNCIYDETFQLSNNKYTLSGWKFVGWNTQADGQGLEYKDGQNVSNLSTGATVFLYAQWSANIYSVVYIGNKPSNASNPIEGKMSDSEFAYDCYYQLPVNTYVLKGWSFKGWNTSPDGKGTSYLDVEGVTNLTVESSITLYAQWGANHYTIEYDSNVPSATYGTVQNKMAPTDHVFDTPSLLRQELFILTAPKGLYYSTMEIVGWAESPDGSVKYGVSELVSNINWNENGITTLYAVWDYIEYDILINVIGQRTIRYSTYNFDKSVTVYYSLLVSYFGTGYDYFYKANDIVPLHSTGPMEFEFELIPITYTLNLRVIALYEDEVVETLQEETYQLSYFDEMIFVAEEIQGYSFLDIGVLKYYNGDIYFEVVEEPRIIVKGMIPVKGGRVDISIRYNRLTAPGSNPCVAAGTLITLADGSQMPVESLNGNELLLVWNLFTGTFDVAPIIFIDNHPEMEYDVISLTFSDGTQVDVIGEHAFWDFDLNQYVYLRKDASQYIGHWFNKQSTLSDGEMSWTRVRLVDVTITLEYTTAWSPVTYGHLCYYVNGMLSMPGAIEGFINIFEVDADAMRYDETKFAEDIETYGLFTYEEFAEIYPISEEVFEAFGGAYLKVSLGKGLIDYETIGRLIERYAEFLNI